MDDDPGILRLIQRVLEGAAHSVLLAKDGREGMKLYLAHRPDLVITDIVMPDQEGMETIIQLRRIDPAAKIIAISGSPPIGKRTFLDLAGALGANAVLAKPFRAAELLALVDGLVGTPKGDPDPGVAGKS